MVGAPVAHSLSPVLHNAGYAALGMDDWSYRALECDSAALPGLVASLDERWAGLSVTMPNKAVAARLADHRTPLVDLLGAANTLVRRADGWHADNTDVGGMVGALRAHAVPRPDRALILGTGGTARSAVAALAEMRAGGVVVAGRTAAARAEVVGIAGDAGLPAEECDLTGAAVAPVAASCELVLCTVPAGVADPFASLLAGVPALFDVIYHPWPTPVAAAGGTGRSTVTGLDLLLHQALRQFELLTGRAAPAAAMRDALREAAGVEVELPLA